MLGNGFTRKKVGSLTLGEKLRKIRADYHVNLAEVARETGIRREHLEYLESGEYAKLPADVYARGFLRSYGRFLGVDSNALIRLYDRERSIAKNLGKDPEKEKPSITLPSRRFSLFVVTPRMMIGFFVFSFVCGIVFYLYREYRTFVSEPYLTVLEPSNGISIGSDETTIAGKTDRDAKLFLNDQPVFVNEVGEFRERIRFQLGVNTIRVKVVNRFGKERAETVSVIAEYAVLENAPTPEAPPVASPLPKLVLSLLPTEKKPASILVRSDGEEIFQGELSAGEMKEFECEKGCTVDSTSGKGTLAAWNGGEPKPVSEKSGTVIGVMFSVDEGETE